MPDDDPVYVLLGYIPYDGQETLFEGSEEELKEFIKKHTTTGAPFNGKPYKNVKRVAGFYLDDLTLYIEGPDIRMYIE